VADCRSFRFAERSIADMAAQAAAVMDFSHSRLPLAPYFMVVRIG
jgi:hypothetical protein